MHLNSYNNFVASRFQRFHNFGYTRHSSNRFGSALVSIILAALGKAQATLRLRSGQRLGSALVFIILAALGKAQATLRLRSGHRPSTALRTSPFDFAQDIALRLRSGHRLGSALVFTKFSQNLQKIGFLKEKN